jgi:hypothetical protein
MDVKPERADAFIAPTDCLTHRAVDAHSNAGQAV